MQFKPFFYNFRHFPQTTNYNFSLCIFRAFIVETTNFVAYFVFIDTNLITTSYNPRNPIQDSSWSNTALFPKEVCDCQKANCTECHTQTCIQKEQCLGCYDCQPAVYIHLGHQIEDLKTAFDQQIAGLEEVRRKLCNHRFVVDQFDCIKRCICCDFVTDNTDSKRVIWTSDGDTASAAAQTCTSPQEVLKKE